MKSRLSIILTIIVSVVLVALLVLMVNLDNIFTPKADEDVSALEIEKDMRTVVIDNEKYIQNYNDNIMIMLIPEYSTIITNGEEEIKLYSNVNDINILSFNSDNEEFSVLDINVLTQTYVKELNKTGSVKQTQITSIGSAYMLANGSNQGCYNTVEAVRDYLFGLKFNQYVCVDKSTLKEILDYIDGVEIETIGGKISIDGENVDLAFDLQAKDIVKAIIEKVNDSSDYSVDYLYELVESITDKLLTNCNQYTLRKIVRVVHNFENKGFNTIDGQYVDQTFESDINDLKKKVVGLFYEKRED